MSATPFRTRTLGAILNFLDAQPALSTPAAAVVDWCRREDLYIGPDYSIAEIRAVVSKAFFGTLPELAP